MILQPCTSCRYSITCTSEDKQKAIDNGDCERYRESDTGHLSEAAGS